MKLGPRVALITTLLMAGVLAAASWALLRIRRADLEGDLQRQARDVADALAAGLEPMPPSLDAREMMERRVAKGDLARAVLPERDDEVGALAGRFNAMTNYLRQAREEEGRANAARLALETRLRHSEKLATMGQMAAEIAHEVGTPLGVIAGR